MRSARSVPAILSDLITQLTDLVRNEGRLARVEMSEKASQITSGLTTAIIGAVLLIPALVILLEAAVAAVERGGIQDPWASLIIGGAALLLGFILLMIGMSRLKPEKLMPNRTIRQIQENAAIIKSKASDQVSEDDDFQRAA
jgi:putative superfamily III holin-X